MALGKGSSPILLGALAGLLTASPVAAQDPMEESQVGSRFAREKFDSKRAARETMAYFGRCLAINRGDRIRDYLVEPTLPKLVDLTDFQNGTRCAVRDMAASPLDYRGSVSEGWYLHQFEDAPPPYFATAANQAPPQEETAALIIAADEASKPQVVIDEFARCVAAVNPLGVDALLRTEQASTEEGAAIQALAPSFGPCAFEGQKLAFDQAGLRSALAYALATRAVREVAE